MKQISDHRFIFRDCLKIGANMSNFIDKGKDISSNMRCDVNGNIDDESISILKNSVNSINSSMLAGVSYEFDLGLVLDARYNVSLTPTFREFEGEHIITGSNGWSHIGAGWKL